MRLGESNSKGFWRRNTIQGLHMTLQAFRYPYGDPEEKERHERLIQELQNLERQEAAVRRRLTLRSQHG